MAKEELARLGDLKPGQAFRYQGSDENDWHTVMEVDECRIKYTGGFAGEANTSLDVQVILKEPTAEEAKL